jgi:tRNA-guanine family transglycosylase
MILSQSDIRTQLKLEGTTLMMDSTGYQQMTLRSSASSQIDPIQVLRYQERNGTNIAMTFDMPFRPDDTSLAEGWRRIKLSIEYAKMELKERAEQSMRLYCVIHGWDYLSVRKVAEAVSQCDFDGYALGAPEPLTRNMGHAAYLERLAQLITAAKESLGDRPLHVLGIANLSALYLMAMLGVSSFDTLRYLHGAKYRDYFMPMGYNAALGRLREGGRRLRELPCFCPICSNVTIDQLASYGSLPGALVAVHNIFALKSYVSTINSALENNWFDEALDRAARLTPALQKPIQWVKNHHKP